tara:strand:- start:2057 stop:3220 length:1164 start_codon:yes stop_codon:yes gene_type:complete
MRNRIIYNNVGLLTGPSPAYQAHSGTDGSSKLTSINTVQVASFEIGINRAEVKQIGIGTSIGGPKLTTRHPVTQPNVSLGFSYNLTDGRNEKTLGFNVAGNTSFLSGVTGNDDRNFFLFITEKAEQDFNLQSGYSNADVLSFGNCYLNRYGLSASVGSFPMVSVDFSASNVRFDQPSSGTYQPGGNVYASGLIPAVDRQNGTLASDFDNYGYVVKQGTIADGGIYNSGDIHYLKPGDIELFLSNPSIGGIKLSGDNKMNVQDISIDIPINRTDLYGLGSKYVYDRKAEYPSLGQLNVSATATYPVSGVTDKIFSDDDVYQMEVRFNTSDSSSDKTHTISAKIQDAKIESQSISESIGSNMLFSATFSFECSTSKGFLFSGLAGAVGD